jgi:NAD(P)-dependent dehydrogenase (short-subunit alcohol dehydrogenase family)
VIDRGDIAIATARKPAGLSFKNTTSENYLAVELDVTKLDQIKAALAEAKQKFGRIDVVVNNAGYGLAGPFEELKEEQVRTQMEVNFFGLIEVTRQALEVMREQKPSGGVC